MDRLTELQEIGREHYIELMDECESNQEILYVLMCIRDMDMAMRLSEFIEKQKMEVI